MPLAARTRSGKLRCTWDIAKQTKGYSHQHQCKNPSKAGFLFCGTHLKLNKSLPVRLQVSSIDKWTKY